MSSFLALMAEASETRRLNEIWAFLSAGAGATAEYSLGFERNSGGGGGILMLAVLERRIRPWLCDGLCSRVLSCRGCAAWPCQWTMFPFRVGNNRCLTIGNTTSTVNHNQTKDGSIGCWVDELINPWKGQQIVFLPPKQLPTIHLPHNKSWHECVSMFFCFICRYWVIYGFPFEKLWI